MAEDTREAGQAGRCCQPQPVSERLGKIGRRGGQLGEGRHALTLQRLAVTVKLTGTHLAV